MPKYNNSSEKISRRSILRKSATGAGVAGVAGLGQSAAAWDDDPDIDVRQLSKLPQVRSILDELNIDTIPRSKSVERNELNLLEQESEEAVSSDSTVLKVEFGFGELLVGERTGETNAFFTFSDESPTDGPDRAVYNRLPEKYTEIPSETYAKLTGSAGDAVFTRMATDTERDAVIEDISIDSEETPRVFTGSEFDGFYVNLVTVDGVDSQVRQFEVVPKDDGTAAPDDGVVATAVADSEFSINYVGTITHDDITAEASAQCCGAWCQDCLEAIIWEVLASCRWCAPKCSAGATLPGAIACIGCVGMLCSSVLTTTYCALCYDSCT